MTKRELLDAMGADATDEEADAMREILRKRGIDSLNEINDDDFLALIPEGHRTSEGSSAR